jgi:hypothetical protein
MSAACPELGFEITLELAADVADARRRALRAAFLALVESRGLAAAGNGDTTLHYWITRDGGQAIDADRDALDAWAAGRPEIARATAGPLVDLREAAI